MAPLRDRPTIDLLVMFLTAIVGIVVLGVLATTFIKVWRNPGADISGEARFMTTTVSSLMTGVIGYIGGRATSNKNGNGKDDHTDPKV